MIRITCTQCRSVLEIDDAFAGGVCRCQHCGTIQTVPAHLKGNADGTAAAPEAASAADTSQHRHIPYASNRTAKKKPMALWIALGGVAAVVLVLIGFVLARKTAVTTTSTGKSVTMQPGTGAGTPNLPEIVTFPQGPNFVGVDLSSAKSVVYLVDAGSTSGAAFDTLKAGLFHSAKKLGPTRTFAMTFWQSGKEPLTPYPATGMATASEENVDKADIALEDIRGGLPSDPTTAIKDAVKRKPTDIVFIAGKNATLPKDLALMLERSLPKARIHSVAIEESPGDVLDTIAKKHRGTFKVVTLEQIRAFTKS